MSSYAVTAQKLPIEIVPPAGHSGDGVASGSIAANGAILVTSGEDYSIRVWDVQTGRYLRTVFVDTAAKSPPKLISLSPQGHVLLASVIGGFKVFDTLAARELLSFVEDAANYVAAMSADGTRVASSNDSTIKVWDTQTGKLISSLKGHSGLVTALAFSPDGRQIVSGSADRTVRRWRVNSADVGKLLSAQDWPIAALKYSSTGQKLLVQTLTSAQVLDAWSGSAIYNLSNAGMANFDFSLDENYLISSDAGWLKLFNLVSRREPQVCNRGSSQFDSLVGFAAYSGRVLLQIGKDIHAIAMSTCEESTVAAGQDLLALSADKRRMLVEGNKVLTLVDIATAAPIQTFTPNLKMSRFGGLSGSGAAQVWRDSEGAFHLREVVRHSDIGRCSGTVDHDGAFDQSADGRWVLTVDDSHSVKLCDSTSSNGVSSFSGHASAVDALASSSSLRYIASADADGNVRVWDVRTKQAVRVFKGKGRPVNVLRFSSDGRRIFAGTDDNLVRIWEVSTGKEIHTLRMMAGPVTAMGLSPDGRTIAAGTGLLEVRTWDVETGRQTQKLVTDYPGERMLRTRAVVFSPSDNRVIAATYGNRLFIWNADSGKLVRAFGGTGPTLNSLAFSADGRRLLSVDEDGVLKYWNPTTGVLLGSMTSYENGAWIIVTPEGFFDASSPEAAQNLSVVRGFENYSIEQFYQSLYRPDLVREKLLDDPRGQVRAVAATLNLEMALASGEAPAVGLTLSAPGTAAAGQVVVDARITDHGGGIGRVEWRVNHLTVGVEQPAAAPAGQPLRLTRSLALEAGDHVVEVVAYNRANLIASVPAQVAVAIAAVPASAPGAPPTDTAAAAAPRLFVLAAGSDNYADRRFQLQYSVPDAKAVAQAFMESGKGLYQSVDVKVMSDDEVVTEKLEGAFQELSGKMHRTDVFVLYLAGHGKTVDGRYYFIPQDFRIGSEVSGGSVIEAAVRTLGISQEQWQRWFTMIPATRSLILFDTCESGTLTGDAGETKLLERGAASDRLAQATGRSIITASSGSTDAFEGYRGHGLFTYNLLDALDRGDGDGSGTIEVTELATFVYSNVTAISEQVFKQRQEPQMRITLNYPLTRQAHVLSEEAPAVAMEAKPAHQLAQTASLRIKPGSGATVVRSLSPKTAVTVIKSEGGWSLIASQGRTIGYVASQDLELLK